MRLWIAGPRIGPIRPGISFNMRRRQEPRQRLISPKDRPWIVGSLFVLAMIAGMHLHSPELFVLATAACGIAWDL